MYVCMYAHVYMYRDMHRCILYVWMYPYMYMYGFMLYECIQLGMYIGRNA